MEWLADPKFWLGVSAILAIATIVDFLLSDVMPYEGPD